MTKIQSLFVLMLKRSDGSDCFPIPLLAQEDATLSESVGTAHPTSICVRIILIDFGLICVYTLRNGKTVNSQCGRLRVVRRC